MRLFFVLLLTVFQISALSCASRAQEEETLNPERAFYRANIYYEAGDYNKAIEENSSILEKGLKSGPLYYNLGNAYFKKGELGEAVLNYERARRFIPRDSDLLSNYRHAKSLMKRQEPPAKGIRIVKMLKGTMNFLTLKEAVTVTSVIYYLLILYIIMTKVFKKFRGFSTLVIWILSFTLIVLFIPLIHKIRDAENGAIIVSRITDAKFEPLKDATVHFPLYEGTKVYILRDKGDWAKIKRPDGKIGWVRKEAVELIGM